MAKAGKMAKTKPLRLQFHQTYGKGRKNGEIKALSQIKRPILRQQKSIQRQFAALNKKIKRSEQQK